jgi:hypothetical protein
MSLPPEHLRKIACFLAGNFFCAVAALFFTLSVQPMVAAEAQPRPPTKIETPSASVSQFLESQHSTDKVALKRAAPLDILSALAGLAAVISIAYAGLPNFRHRSRVQDHVRRRVQNENIIANLNQTLCSSESWGVLYRLGKLQEIKAPAPGLKKGLAEVDRNFQMRSSFKAYSWIYASNFDKIVAGILAALAASVIWFAAIDNYLFFETTAQDAKRIAFLSGLATFYITVAALSLVAMIVQRLLWQWEMPHRCWREIFIHISIGIFCAAFLLFAILATFHVKFITDFYWNSEDHIIFILMFTVLFSCTSIPLVLWWIGETLTRIMIREGDISVEALVGIINENAGTAEIDAAAH